MFNEAERFSACGWDGANAKRKNQLTREYSGCYPSKQSYKIGMF